MPFAAEIMSVGAQRPGDCGSNNRLLVVDQQLAFVGFARLVGRRMGYETGAVLNPSELAARVREWRPTVLVVEIVLPDLDGIEIIGILSELGFDGHIVLVTAHEPKYLELVRKTAEMKGLRIAACLAKPVRTAEMITALELCASALVVSSAAE